MKLDFIEIGKIVNTHGIRGELKVLPQCDTPEQFCEVDTLYIDGKCVRPLTRRIHKGCILMTLPDVDTMDAALSYKNKPVLARRCDLSLPDGRYFNAELIDLRVIDAATEQVVGTIRDVLVYPANNVLVVQGEEEEYLIPAVPAVIEDTDLDAGTMRVRMMKGMGVHEN